jgi:oxalate decarboxylase/phosphoglucose isomerase-like protein (cupin superfamily)
MEIDGARFDVTNGKAIFVPGAAVHNIFNASDRVMKILYVFPTDSLADVEYVFEDGSKANL